MEYLQFNFWCVVEVGLMTATMVTNIVYLFLRSFLKQKMHIMIQGQVMNQDTDFLVSQ